MIIWLSSYPKSGNTWTRSFLQAYLTDKAPDINRLQIPVAGSRKMIDDQLGRSTADLPPPQVRAMRPEAYRRLSAAAEKDGTSPLIIKVHDAFGFTSQGEALFPKEITYGVVYVVRNPLDVAVSFSHHLGVPVEQGADIVCNEKYALSVGRNGVTKQVPQLLRSWRTHVSSWIDQDLLPLVLLKYEDLHADPLKEFRRLLTDLGFEVDEARLKRAVGGCDFHSLQAQEFVRGFREKAPQSNAPFFRRGRVGDGKSSLSPAAQQKVLAYCKDNMVRMGYPTT